MKSDWQRVLNLVTELRAGKSTQNLNFGLPSRLFFRH